MRAVVVKSSGRHSVMPRTQGGGRTPCTAIATSLLLPRTTTTTGEHLRRRREVQVEANTIHWAPVCKLWTMFEKMRFEWDGFQSIMVEDHGAWWHQGAELHHGAEPWCHHGGPQPYLASNTMSLLVLFLYMIL